MNNLIGYTDIFLDPVSGRLPSDNAFPDIEQGHIWLGDENNRPQKSAQLLDIQIDVKSIFNSELIIKDESTLFPNAITVPELKIAPNEATYILQKPNGELKNAQALSILSNGFLKKTDGGTIESKDKISKSEIETLKPGFCIVGGIDGFGIDEISGIVGNFEYPVVEHINGLTAFQAQLRAADFITGEESSLTKSQSLSKLPDGLLKKTGTKLQSAGVNIEPDLEVQKLIVCDDVNLGAIIPDGELPEDDPDDLGAMETEKQIITTSIAITKRAGDAVNPIWDMSGSGNIFAKEIAGAKEQLKAPKITFTDDVYNELIEKSELELTKSPDQLESYSLAWPIEPGEQDDVLFDDGLVPGTTTRQLAFKKRRPPSDLEDGLMVKATDENNESIYDSINLRGTEFPVGGSDGKITKQKTSDFAPSNAQFIVQSRGGGLDDTIDDIFEDSSSGEKSNLSNAQALDELVNFNLTDPQILKISNTGEIQLAVPDTDYVTPSKFKNKTDEISDAVSDVVDDAFNQAMNNTGYYAMATGGAAGAIAGGIGGFFSSLFGGGGDDGGDPTVYLVGERGPQGIQGVQGIQGEPGTAWNGDSWELKGAVHGTGETSSYQDENGDEKQKLIFNSYIPVKTENDENRQDMKAYLIVTKPGM